MSKARKKAYRGELAAPIELESLVPPSRDGEDEQAFLEGLQRSLAVAHVLKLNSLLLHYALDRRKEGEAVWVKLALALAADHVPGFQVVRRKGKRGHPREWGPLQILRLRADVQSLVRKGHGIGRACTELATSPKYRSRYPGTSGSSLKRRYLEHASLAWAGFHELVQSLSLFDRMMVEAHKGHTTEEDMLVSLFALHP